MFATILILLLFVILSAVNALCSLVAPGHDIRGGQDTKYVKLVRTLDDLPFFTNVDAPKPLINRHHGQRKLFLAELQLLNYAIEKNTSNRDILFVYTGAAPCMHLGKLLDMFPNIKFLLIDPNEFWITTDPNKQTTQYDDQSGKFVYLKSSSKIMYGAPGDVMHGGDRSVVAPDGKSYPKGTSPEIAPDEISSFIEAASATQVFIYEDYCTVPLMKACMPLVDKYFTVFMSDIRTISDGEQFPLEIDILWNCAQVYNWVSTLKPDIVSHKHRMPLPDTELGAVQDYMVADFDLSKELGINFLDDFRNSKFTFLSGVAHLQAWVSNSSAETRLIIDKLPAGRIRGSRDIQPATQVSADSALNSFGIPGAYIRIPADYKPHVDHMSVTTSDGMYAIKTYDLIDYDQRMLYHNRVNKARKQFENKYTMVGPKVIIDHCFDCALEADIWSSVRSIAGLDVKKEMSNLHKCLGTKHGGSPEIHNLADLHKKTYKVAKIPASVRYRPSASSPHKN